MRIKDGYLCGDFVTNEPEDGRWRDLGYLGIMHKCESCSNAARFGKSEGRLERHGRPVGKRERYRCAACVEAIKGEGA